MFKQQKLDSPANNEGQSGVGKKRQGDIPTESQSHYEITTESQSENITESQTQITTESQSEITTESQSEIIQSQSEITKSRKSATLHSAAEPEVTPTTIQNSTQPDSLSAGKRPVSSPKPVGLPYRIAFKYETVHKWLYFSAAKNGYCCKYCGLFVDMSSQPKGLYISKAMFVGFDGCNTMSRENKGTYNSIIFIMFTVISRVSKWI